MPGLGGVGSALWGVIIPKETTNLVTNPSLEFGTAGYGALGGGASIGSTSARQAFGAWSLEVRHTTTSEGCFFAVGTPTAGSYTVSAFVYGTSGHRYRLLAETAGGASMGAGSITAGAGWQSIVASFGLPSGTGLNLVLRHIDAANGTFYVDGVQLESGTNATTYVDGDQPGGTWMGAPHASTSTRSGQYRGGGTITALADLGMQPAQMIGAGMPPIDVATLNYAVIDGAQFQRQRAAMKPLTLVAKPIHGTSLADFHVVRQQLISAFSPDLVTPQQPIRFVYVGAAGTQYIDAFYSSGLELGNMDGPIAEDAAIGFLATDPYWYAPTQQGTTLAPRVNLGSTNFIAYKDPGGRWGTLGSDGTTTNLPVASITPIQQLAWAPSGTLYMVGTFTTLAGTAAANMGWYTPSNNRFGTIIATQSLISAIAMLPDESMYIAGTFPSVTGTAQSNIGYYNKTTGGANVGTLTGGTPNSWVRSLLLTPTGTLVAGGQFDSVAGTTIPRVAMYVNGLWGSFTGGTVGVAASSDFVSALAYAKNGAIQAGGRISSVGGTAARGLVFTRDGAWGTMGAIDAGGTIAYSLAVGPDGRTWIGGDFGTIGGAASPSVGVYNGASVLPLSSGIPRTGTAEVHRVRAMPDGRVFFGGTWQGTAGGVPTLDNMAIYNGGAFVPIDIDLPGTANVSDFLINTLGTLYVAFRTSGTATAASIATLINSGRAAAYPTIRFRNLAGVGTSVRPYQIVNTTTGAALYFNLALMGGDVAELDLTPGSRSFTSAFNGNVFNSILPASNLTSLNLLPGPNTVSCFGDSANLETSIFWQVRGWSIDSGTAL